MASHDRDTPPHEDQFPAGPQEKGTTWAHEGYPVLETERKERRMSPARRFCVAFLVCSLVLLGLASVHSPRLWQRISCHDGRISTPKIDVEMGTEHKPPAVTFLSDKASPQVLSDLLRKYFPDQFKDGEWQSDRQAIEAVHHANGALASSMLHLVKRGTNSSSVSATSSSPPVARTSSPEPTSTISASSEPPSSSPSPTPSSSPSPPPSPTTSSRKTSTSSTTSAKPPPVTTSRTTITTTSTRAPPPVTTDETTIYTTRSTSTNPGTTPSTTPRPTTPQVVVETSTRTSNGQLVIVESTITVQPSATGPMTAAESGRPAASLQNAATRQETRGMILAALTVGAVMGVLLL